MTAITVQAGATAFEIEVSDNPITSALFKTLPVSSTAQRWGDEIYFDVPVTVANTQPTRSVQVGDIAYWPDGPSLCIFFGRTPASKGDEPRPASDVTIIGRTDALPGLLRAIKDGTLLTLTASSTKA